MIDRRTGLTIALIACLVLAGCSSGGTGGSGDAAAPDTVGGDGADVSEEMTVTEQEAMADEEADGDQAQSRESDDAERPTATRTDLIRTGNVELRVDDYDGSRERLADRARSMDGYVDSSDERLHREGNRTWETGYVVVRVPAEQFDEMMAAAKSEGTVVTAETETRDVSDQLVDLEARIENLEARRDRLRTFYEEANSTEELLRIEERLSEVQGEIERLRAQKRSLEDKVAYSTIRIAIREPEPEPETTTTTTTTTDTDYADQSPAEAFTDSVSLIVTLARAGVVTLAYLAPFLVLLSVPVAGLAGAWRYRERLLEWLEQFR